MEMMYEFEYSTNDEVETLIVFAVDVLAAIEKYKQHLYQDRGADYVEPYSIKCRSMEPCTTILRPE